MPPLVSETVPLPFWMVPAKLVVPLLPPAVSVAGVGEPFVTVPPAPASEPMVRLLPFRSRVPPLDSVVAERLPKAEVDPAFSVPAETDVVPV